MHNFTGIVFRPAELAMVHMYVQAIVILISEYVQCHVIDISINFVMC